MRIKKENINIETILKDVKLYAEYVGKERSLKVDFNNLQDAIYYIRVSPKRIIPLAFYSYDDAKKVVDNFPNTKRMTDKKRKEIVLFLNNHDIEIIDYLTANDLLYHNEGNWIKKGEYA